MNAHTLQQLTNKLWAARETKCLSIIQRALMILRASDDLPEAEVELNRLLYFCLLTASRELFPDDMIAPITECNNQPDPDDQARASREQKRPDFQWIYLDRYEADPQRSSKQFVVECKRLGEAPRSDWVLNVNYTEHGVNRFIDPKWAYAKNAPSGAMLGYWQSMEGDEVLGEINEGCHRHSISNLVLIGPWSSKGISKCEQEIVRPFPISPFKLHHLWIDIRS